MFRYSLILIFFLVCPVVPDVGAVFSKPYLRIQQVRSVDYPYIQIELSLAKITPIKGIDPNSFEVYENDWKVNSFHVKRIEPEKNPKKTILLVNSSSNLSNNHFLEQIEAIENFTKVLSSNDQIAILSYNDKITKHCGFVTEKLKMTKCIKDIRQQGRKTVLYDAIFEGLKLLRGLTPEITPERHSMILFVGGKDQGSIMEINDVMTMLMNQSNTPIFGIATGNKKDLKSISRISRISGGDIYHVGDTKNFSKIYLLINELLDNRYMIRYVSQASSTSLDGKKVKLLISVNSKDFQESDTYTFFLHDLSLTDLWHKLKTDDSYWLFGLTSALIFIFLSLIIIVIRRPRLIVKEVAKKPEQSSHKTDEKDVSYKNDIEDYIIQREKNTTELKKKTFSKKIIREDAFSKKILAYFVEKEGPNTGRRYEINWENISIGYADENSIALDDPLISYEHAKIKEQGNRFILYDLLSENGTYLNGKKLLRPTVLKDFDEIQLGKTKLIFRKVFQSR